MDAQYCRFYTTARVHGVSPQFDHDFMQYSEKHSHTRPPCGTRLQGADHYTVKFIRV